MKRLGVIVALGAAVGGLPPREVQGRLSAGAARRAKVVMGRRIGLLVSLVALLALGRGLLGATPAWATPPKLGPPESDTCPGVSPSPGPLLTSRGENRPSSTPVRPPTSCVTTDSAPN